MKIEVLLLLWLVVAINGLKSGKPQQGDVGPRIAVDTKVMEGYLRGEMPPKQPVYGEPEVIPAGDEEKYGKVSSDQEIFVELAETKEQRLSGPRPTSNSEEVEVPTAVRVTPLEKKRKEVGSDTVCVNLDLTKCSQVNEDECNEFRVVTCKHGSKCLNNQCNCPYCYAGEDCGGYNGMAIPTFLENSYNVVFTADKLQTYSGIRAEDDDNAFCSSHHQTDCLCGRVVYSLDFDEQTSQETRGLFNIDPSTGKITFNGRSGVQLPQSLKIHVVAGNPTPEGLSSDMTYKGQSRAPLFVQFSDDEKSALTDDISEPEPAHRTLGKSVEEEQRDYQAALQANKDQEVFSGKSDLVEKIPGDSVDPAVAESLEKSFGGADTGVEERTRRKRSTIPGEFAVILSSSGLATPNTFRVAEVNTISINFSLPLDTAGKTLKATVIANPRFRVYTISNPRVYLVGSNIGGASLDDIPVTISDQNDQYVDSFTFDFGVITNSGTSSTDEAQNDIVVKFEVIARNSSDLLDGLVYPVDVYYEYGSASFGTREIVVTYQQADWFMNIAPNVTIGPAINGSVEYGSTFGWIVNITNLTDAASLFRISAFVPTSGQPAGITITNIYRIATGSAFNYFTSDYGNVRASPGAAALQTPWIEVTNRNFWVDSNPGTSDYVTYLVLIWVDETIDTTQVYSVGVQVETANYNYSYSDFFTFPISATQTVATDIQPVFNATLAGGNQMQIGSAISVELTITPTSSYSDSYEIEFDLPYSASVIEFGFAGAVFAPQDNSFEPFVFDTFAASLSGSAVPSSALPTTAINKLTIKTKRTGTPSLVERTAAVYVTFKLLNTSTAFTNNTMVSITTSARYNSVGVEWTENPLDIYLLTCVTDPNPSTVSMSVLPALGDNYLFPWGAQAFYVVVTVPVGETITDVVIEANSPLDPVTNQPLFIFERVYISNQDLGLTILTTSTSFSINPTTGKAKATIPLVYSQDGNEGTQFRVLFAFYTPYDFQSTLVDQNNYSLPVSVTQPGIYCGQSGTSITAYGSYTVNFFLQRPNTAPIPPYAPRIIWTPLTSTVCRKGGTVTYNIDAILPPQFNHWTQIDLFVPDFELDYVGASHISPSAFFSDPNYPVRYTRNNNSFIVAVRGNYVWGHTTNINPTQPITINLGTVSLRLLNNTNLVDGSTHEFNVGIDMTPWRWAYETPLVIANTAKYIFTALPTTSFTKKNTETTITAAAGAVYRARIQTPPESVGKYAFDISVSAGASICTVVIINRGKNVAYVNNTYYTVTVVSPDGGLTNQSWSVVVDFLANAQRSDSTDPTVDNDVYVEVGVCIPSSFYLNGSSTAALEDGDPLQITGTLTVDDTFMHTQTLTNNIVADQLPSEVPQQVNISVMGWANDVNYVHKTLSTLINVSIDTTPHSAGIYTLHVNFSVEPINNEAYGIVEGIKVLSYGKNIICATMISYTSTSTLGNSQTDTGELTFGIVNSGSWTLMPDYYDYLQKVDDNRVTIELQLRHTDHFLNTRNVARPFGLVLTYNNSENVVEMTGYMPPLNVIGTEAPLLATSWTATTVPSSSTPGTTFYISGTVAHTPNSTAHSYLTRLQFFVPPYVSSGTLIAANGTINAPAISTSSGNSIDIVWPVILMEETATFNMSLVIDPTNSVAATIGLIRTEIVSAVKARKLVKVLMNDQYAISGAPIPINENQMTLDTYGADSSRGQFSFTPPSCSAPLGMQNTTLIKDCMIFASSTLTSFRGHVLMNATGPKPGRLTSGAAWMPFPRGNPFYSNDYLLVNLGGPATIAAVDVQGDATYADQFVTQIQLQYSVDGTRWQTYVDSTGSSLLALSWSPNGTRTAAEISTLVLDPTIEGASFVRVIPKLGAGASPNPFMPLRVEFRGCINQATRNTQCLTDFLVSPTPNYPNTPADYTYRSYIWVEQMTALFVCSQPSVEEYATCSRYDAVNGEWRDIPVSAVTAFDAASGALTAITQLGTTAVSHDNGFSWVESDDGSNADIAAAVDVNSKYKQLPYLDTMCNSTLESGLSTYGYASATIQSGVAPQPLSVKHTGVLYGSGYTDLYYWGSGNNWVCTP